MKRKIVLLTAVLTLGVLTQMSHAQVQVGAEDFESYPIGAWNASNAPVANPVLKGGVISADIVDSGSTNGLELQVDTNLSNQWFAAVTFNLDLSGNASSDIADYSMDVYVRFDPATVNNLTNSAFEAVIYNPNNAAQGTQVSFANLDPAGYEEAKTNGYTFHVPLSSAFVPWDKQDRTSGNIPTWLMYFQVGNNLSTNDKPVNFIIDNVVVNYTEPPFVNPAGLPTGLVLTNGPTVTGTVIDGTLEVATMELYVDSTLVASNSTYAGGSTTNSISFVTSGLVSDGTTHTAEVVATDASGTNSVSHSWSFVVYDTPSAPETNPIGMFNINIQGSDGVWEWGTAGGFHPVTNGTVAVAPSMGTNGWYNVGYSNPWYFGWQSKSVPESSGIGPYTNSITYELLESSSSIQLYLPWGPLAGYTPLADGSMWVTALGGPDANMDIELRDLDSNQSYDLYLYFTCPEIANPETTTTYTMSSGITAIPAATLVAIQAPLMEGGMDNYVENTNYVVITDITPENGKIAFNVAGDSAGGGISAMQLVVRKPYPLVAPDLQTITMSNDVINLSWNSQDFISYKILSRESLTLGSWNLVTNGIPGTGSATTSSVPVSASQEFFMIESN